LPYGREGAGLVKRRVLVAAPELLAGDVWRSSQATLSRLGRICRPSAGAQPACEPVAGTGEGSRPGSGCLCSLPPFTRVGAQAGRYDAVV
jgi:hypothetical protein